MSKTKDSSTSIKQVGSAQKYIKGRYGDTIGLATSILGQVLLGTIKGSKRKKEVVKLCLKDMKRQFADRVAENPRMEIEFMMDVCNVGHPYFVRYLDAIEDPKLFCICLEYVKGGDMCTYIQNLGAGIGNERAKKYIIQLCKAVYFMHNKGYCHLDLSLENVLWDKSEDCVKICDFGLCRKFVNENKDSLFPAACIRPGKKGYMSPEIYAYQKFNGEKSDVFSIGVIIFILLTGFPPFNTPNASDKCFQYMYYGKLEWLLKQWKLTDLINNECTDLLSKIFCHPKKRISMVELLEHPWLNQEICQIEAQMNELYSDKIIAAPPPIAGGTDHNHENIEKAQKKNKKKEVLEKKENNQVSPTPPINNTHYHSQSSSNESNSSSNSSQSSSTVKRKKRKSMIIKKRRSSKSNKKQAPIATIEPIHVSAKNPSTNDSPHSHSHSKRSNSMSLCESATLLSEFGAIVNLENKQKTNEKIQKTKKSKRSQSFSYNKFDDINYKKFKQTLSNLKKTKENLNEKSNENVNKNHKKNTHSMAKRSVSNRSRRKSQTTERNVNVNDDDFKNDITQSAAPVSPRNHRYNHQNQNSDDSQRRHGEEEHEPPVHVVDTAKITQEMNKKHKVNLNNNNIVNEYAPPMDHLNDCDRKEGDYSGGNFDTDRFDNANIEMNMAMDEERRLSLSTANSHESHHNSEYENNKYSKMTVKTTSCEDDDDGNMNKI